MSGGGSLTIERGPRGWRYHVPAMLLVAAGALINGGSCTKQDAVIARLDDLNTRVARLEGALLPRARYTGAEGSGGNGAATNGHP